MIKKSKKTTTMSKSKFTKQPLLIYLIIVTVIGLAAVVYFYTIPSINNSIRKSRIENIYSSLNLNVENYYPVHESVFGEKKVYDWDKSRTFSSQITYVRKANVDTTVAELKEAVAKTDFAFYEEPYPGGVNYMYIYKSPKNEYLRISASSKARDDAFFNNYAMGLSTDKINIDPNQGPTNVSIKVNLDDNNE